jgi:LuxR family transcriptional regulator, maltose regulon positive regulatory protein
MAIWLANDHLGFRGREAVTQGWLRRATLILNDLDPVPEHGWLAALEAQFALEDHQRPDMPGSAHSC